MIAHAIIFPARESYVAAVNEALAMPHRPELRLATNGRQLAWLPRVIPGWFPITHHIERSAA